MKSEMKDNLGGRTLKYDSITDANLLLVIFFLLFFSQMMSLPRHKVVGGEGTVSFPPFLCEIFAKHESGVF